MVAAYSYLKNVIFCSLYIYAINIGFIVVLNDCTLKIVKYRIYLKKYLLHGAYIWNVLCFIDIIQIHMMLWSIYFWKDKIEKVWLQN